MIATVFLSKLQNQKFEFYRSLQGENLYFIEVYITSHCKYDDMMTVQHFLSILSSQKEELETNELTSFVSRYEEPLINLDSRMAQVVIGVRRSGKSTICE